MSLTQRIQTHLNHLQQQRFTNGEEVNEFRKQWLSQKGIIKTLFEAFRSLPSEEKKVAGKQLNELKTKAETLFRTHEHLLNKQAAMEDIDLSLPAAPLHSGSRHPIARTLQRIIAIFAQLGFAHTEGPEIEDDWHNFSALNMPEDHPARDMQDTFYLPQTPFLLRTHTSNTQIRAMKKGDIPLRIVCSGKVYRNETISARAHCFFHQIEGLYINRKVAFSDLKQTLHHFTEALFGHHTKVRLRPSYFPFTQPSAEMDISCLICSGKGCAVCKQSGWLEILGCGMVHPQVLQNGRIDPEQYQGFAFGMGIERMAMLLHRIKDIRLFSENHTQFLRQFAGF